MSDIGPGSPVIFIQGPTLLSDASGLTRGALYVVDRVAAYAELGYEPCPLCGSEHGLELVGRPGNFDGYCVHHFRPPGDDDALAIARDVATPAPSIPIPIFWGERRVKARSA